MEAHLAFDEVFEQLTVELVKSVLKLSDLSDVNLIHKWHKIFLKASQEELLARNCLCGLMLKQLRRDGRLSSEFRDTTNCVVNLKELLSQMVSKTSNDLGMSTKTQICAGTELSKFKSTVGNTMALQQKDILHFKILKLKSELHRLKMQLDEVKQQNEYLNLEEIMETMVDTLTNFLHSRVVGIEAKFNLFESVFGRAVRDPALKSKLHDLDANLEKTFNEYTGIVITETKFAVEKTALSSGNNFHEELRKMHQFRLNLQKWVQNVELHAIKEKVLNIIRNTLHNVRNDDQRLDIKATVDIIDGEYERIIKQYEEAEVAASEK